MKKIYPLIFALLTVGAGSALADSFTISTSGVSYSPSDLFVVVGDQITIAASGSHPLVQVSEATWNSNGSTQLPGGFGTENSDYTFTVTEAGNIYYVCTNHINAGMKGMITVSLATGVSNLASANRLQVYPTVVTDGSFTVKAGTDFEASTLEIYNVNGQLLKSFAIESELQTLHAALAAGTYSAILRKNNLMLHRERMVFMK